MRDFKKIGDNGYMSILTNKRWFFVAPNGKVINTHKGEWHELGWTRFFVCDNGSVIDLNHVFVKPCYPKRLFTK